MKKSELKSGMVVENRRGKRGIVFLNSCNGDVIGGGEYSWDEGTWGPLDNFDDDLKSFLGNVAYDIVKVYNPNSNRYFGQISGMSNSDLIWERVDIVELTMEDIAEKFGIDVNNLKIKK